VKKIFAFVNSVAMRDWYSCIALSEDGDVLAGHVCSSPSWGPHDMGVTSDWKHETYRAAYPDGFHVEWVEDVANHAGAQAAIAKHKAKSEIEKATAAAKASMPSVEVELSDGTIRRVPL